MAQRQQQQQQPISQTPAAADPFSSSYHLSPRTDTNVQAPAPPPKSPRTAQRSREASAATSIGAAEAGEPTPNGIPNHAHGLSNDRSPNPPPTAVGSQSQRPAPQRQDMLEQEERSAAAVPSSDELKRQPTWAKGIDFDTSNFALDFDQFSSPGLPASASPSGGPSPAQYPTASTGSARRDGPSALTDDRPSDSWQDDRRAQNRGDGSAGRKTPGASSSSTGKGRDGREKTRSREKDREQELLSSDDRVAAPAEPGGVRPSLGTPFQPLPSQPVASRSSRSRRSPDPDRSAPPLPGHFGVISRGQPGSPSVPVFPVNGPGEALSPGIPVSAIGQEEWNFGPTLEPEFAYVYADEVASGARKSGESSKSNSGTEDKEKRKDRQRRRAETAPLMEDEAQKIAMPHVRSRTEQPGPSHTRGPSGERGMPLERAQWHQDVADSAASPRASSGSPAQPNGQRAAMGAAQGYASPQRQSSEWSQSLNTTPRAPQAATMTPMNTASSGATARAIQADIRSDSPADDWSHPQQQQQQQPFSSADIYAPRPNSALSVLGAGNGNAGGSRPGTSLSMLSADQYSGDGDPKRSSYSTSASGAGNAKRASVLSFQTALSGHVMDGLLNADEAGRLSRSSQRPGDQEEMFEEVQDAPEQNAWSAPWTYGGGGGVDAQDGWRSGVPGGWTDRNDAMPGAAMAEAGPPALPPKSEQQKRWSQLQRQAAGAPEVLAPPRESHSRDPSGVGPGPPKLRADTDVPRLAELAASSPFGLDIPASSTVGPSSSDSDTALPGRGPSTALVSSHAEQAVSPEARLTLPQPHARQDTTVAQENALAPTSVALVPLPPSPLAPPVPTKDDTLEVPELGNKEPASPVFSDSVIPPPLPAEVVAQQGDQQLQVVAPPTNAPVSDFRARPLANISPATQTAGLEQLQAQKDQLISGHEDEAEDVDEAPRAPSESIDTPPREPSPPPDGEVEARAEWERAQMKQKQGRDEGPRKPSFRTQLKPLQLVPADSEGQTSVLRRPASTMSFPSPRLESATATGTPDESSPLQTVAAKALGQGGREQGAAQATGSPTSQMSTQQLQQHLQRQQAREQRRSVGALSMNMGGTETLTAGGNNGPYPIFPSPTTAASKPGAQRQYPGLMPQRSLVPPFELQQRPDGLPSGLTGPDGVRRSPNDPEVCLECMMRDEDMIDVHVVGPGLWERESDREFEDAKRIEEEEEARDRDRETSGASVLGSTTPSREGGEALSASHAHSYAGSSRETAPSQSQSRANVKLRVRKVGRGDPLTADRLKLHTQMNPPASSHRWRTLQTFLAIQAKYIAMEQRARAEADRERGAAVARDRERNGQMGLSDYDNKLVRTTSGPSESIKSGKNRKRSSSVSLLKSGLIVEEIDLRAEEREAKERDISAAREARRKMSASTPEPSRSYSGPVPPVPKLSANNSLPEDDRRRFSSPMPDLSAGHHSIPRRSGAMPSSTNRSGSAQDLRAISGAMLSANPPASPASSLAPPTRPFATGSPRSPSRTGGAGASTLSLAQSGSMIDMHVGLEDGVEHRMSQAGFVPGTPVQVESPSMINRAYYGFPGDGEDGGGMGRSLPPQPVPEEEQDVARQVSRDTGGDDSLRKKKKGFKGFFQKITGGGNNATTGGATAQQASREQARQSSSSGSPRARRASLGPENSLELPPPPGFSALLNRARRSTSSLINSQAGQGQSQAMNDAADRARSGSPAPGTGPYQNPLGPGMASQISLDPGPFGAGTGAGGRERDLGPFHSPNSPHSPQHPSRVDQVRGAGGRLRTNSSNPNMSAHMSPSMNANSNANAANHPGSPQMQMYNGSPGSPYSIARRFSQAQQVGGGTESRTNSIISSQSRNGSRGLASAALPSLGSVTQDLTEEAAGDRRGLNMSASGAPVPYGEDEPRGSLALSSREAVHKSLPPVPPGMMAFGGGSGDGSGPIPGLPPKHARAPSGTLNELRYPSGYLPGLNGQHHPPGMDPRQSLSGSRPAGYSNAGTTSHSPSGSFQMTDSGRASMQAARPNGAMLQAQGHGHPFPPQQNQNQGSGGGRQPTRPPRNPKRPDGAPGSPSGPSSASSHRQMQMQQQQAQQQQQRQQQSWNPRDDLPPRAVSSMGQNDARDKPRKSKLLKLPFGRKKRDSTAGDERPAGTKPGASGLGLGLPPLRNRKSFGALDDLVESGPGGGGGRQPKNSFHVERQRVLSAPNDMRNHPPRAQSAMGRLPTQNFVHMPGMPMPGIEDSDDEDDFAAAAGRPFGSGPGPSFLSGPGANAVLAKGPRRQASGASMKSPSDKEKDKDKTAGARRGSGSWKRASGPLSIPIPLPGARRSSSTKSKKKLQQAQQPMHAQQQQRHGSILQEESFVAIRYPSGSPN